jgi:hypothetical protein
MKEWNSTYRYLIGQTVRSICDYHRGETGMIRSRQSGEKEPYYTVQFADNACVFLREAWLEPALLLSEVNHDSG